MYVLKASDWQPAKLWMNSTGMLAWKARMGPQLLGYDDWWGMGLDQLEMPPI